jgi:hypothetical protein
VLLAVMRLPVTGSQNSCHREREDLGILLGMRLRNGHVVFPIGSGDFSFLQFPGYPSTPHIQRVPRPFSTGVMRTENEADRLFTFVYWRG